MPRWLIVAVAVFLGFCVDLAVLAPEVVESKLSRAPAGEPAWWSSRLGVAEQMLRPRTDFAAEVSRFYWFLHLLVGGTAGYAVYRLRTSRPRPRDASGYGSHGSARWATEADLRKQLRPPVPASFSASSRAATWSTRPTLPLRTTNW